MMKLKHGSFVRFFCYLFSGVGIAFFLLLFLFLLLGSFPALHHEGFDFLRKADWFYRGDQFGALSMLYGTGMVSLIAILFAAPLGVGAAFFTAEYLHGKIRLFIKSLIELLAAIPSVVYGMIGILYLRPFVFRFFHHWSPETGDNLLTAGLLLGIMILPTVMSLSEDALRGVPQEDRENARALGLTKQETLLSAVFPKALPGFISAILLGLGRALGETIAVYLVVGRADNRIPNPFYSLRPLLEAGQTLTSKLGGSETYLAYGDPLHWSAMLGLGLILFVVVVALFLVGETLLLFGKEK